jgi:hypothetical protein
LPALELKSTHIALVRAQAIKPSCSQVDFHFFPTTVLELLPCAFPARETRYRFVTNTYSRQMFLNMTRSEARPKHFSHWLYCEVNQDPY